MSLTLLRDLFDTAVTAVQPAQCLAAHLPSPPKGRTIVVGAGKAAAAMAQALETVYPVPVTGLVVTRTGYGLPCRQIEVVEASHPVPDANGVAAAERILAMMQGLTADDLVIFLVSGGGSALLSLPTAGLSLDDKRTITKELLSCGATINEINTVRKHLSAIKGGRLAAAAAPARFVTLAISDVVGDDPAVIASGPGVADPSTREQALAIIDRYGLTLPPSIRAWLKTPAAETPKVLPNASVTMIATPNDALNAAAAAAQQLGIRTQVLGDDLEGEARDLGAKLAAMALSHRQDADLPLLILSGGEVTVTLGSGRGAGGPNSEAALSLALTLNGVAGIYALFADTDGCDGGSLDGADVAGALVAPDTLELAREKALSPRAALDGHDTHRFFHTIGRALITGPTYTNVNDFRAVLITAS